MTETSSKLSGAYWIKPPWNAYEKKGLDPDVKENRFVYYRYTVHLDTPGSLELSISANSRYRLWVNGEPVVSGPCKGDRWRHYYETLDVSSYLRPGLNIFAVQVWSLNTYLVNDPLKANQPIYSISSLPIGPRLAVRGVCINAQGEVLADLTTGFADWQAAVDDAITVHSDNQYTIYMGAIAERVKGALLPRRWKEEAEPEGGWYQAEKSDPCLSIGDPYPHFIVPTLPLVSRPIPLLYERQREFVREMPIRQNDLDSFSFYSSVDANYEVNLPPHSNLVIELDAGELVTGYPLYYIDQGKGAKVTFRYAERYFEPGNVKNSTVRDDAYNGVIMGFEDIYYPSGQAELYEPFWLRTFRFIRIEVQTGESPILLRRPRYLESAYPLQAKSSVASPADWVEPLYNVSLRTLQFCMHETYEDCPYYEQMQFIMDTRLQALFTYSVGGDIGLARKALEDFHCSLLPEGITQNRFPSTMVQIIPSFSLHYIFMLHDYYQQTGDTELVKRYRPTVDAILDWFERKVGNTGLVERIGYWEYIDWVTEWEAGEPAASKEGPSTVHNLVYVSALQVAAQLSIVTGRSQVGEEYELRARGILQSIERLCWSEQQGMYCEGPAFEQYSQHAQLWAVLTGLSTGEKAKRVMNNALDKPEVLKCSFSMAFFLFRALEKAGMYERTVELMNQWIELLPLNLTTLPETPTESRSDCHAWSALPLYELTHCILGVKSLKPGWCEVLIEPHTLNLPEMKGEISTPAGIISVNWKKTDKAFYIAGNVPDGIALTVRWNGVIDVNYPNGGSFNESVNCDTSL
ncbi:alpha-L-rhamnosidase C-terminal domain-containing protein [Paenibacillus graminis]|uniref:alpha-L-rhamnosidase-related protein n=1 Tax=Paenibacillus graminis TaxID=189425 RepID=UPI00138E551B|nr:alpha-L-rhamnosidase C-terminal domain-containing protein [Paenibacillus graminis]